MVKRTRGAQLLNNIALLQNLVRRDPNSYKDEFLVQYRHYLSQKEILSLNPANMPDPEAFSDLVGFLAHVSVCYPAETKTFPDDLGLLLTQHHTVLPVNLREKIVQSLVLLKNRNVISAERLVQILFPLLTTTNSKAFRKEIYNTIVRLLKHANRTAKAPKLNRSVQTLLFTLLESSDGSAAAPDGLWAARLTRELWRRSIWDDARSVEIMKQSALHGNSKVAMAGVIFFLSADREREKALKKRSGADDSSDESGSDSDSESDADTGYSRAKSATAAMKHRLELNKKSGKRARKLEAAVKSLRRKERGASNLETHLNFSAIHLLHDPQGFADRLFTDSLSRNSGNRFNLEQRIQILNLVSRLIGVHKLSLLALYSYILKFLTPKQRNVTQFMACAAQASHDLVPPDAISPVIRKIADEFVSDGVASEVAAAGINTIREILARNPLAIDADLLHDLTEYKGSKAKSVMMASRSLIGLYRDVAPEMLQRKDRGKIASMELSSGESNKLQFGKENVIDSIPGLELLEKWREEQEVAAESANGDVEGAEAKKNQEAAEDEEWKVHLSDSEDSEGGWIDVESDKEYNVSDDDNDDEDRDGEDADSDIEESNPAVSDVTDGQSAKRIKLDATQSLMATKFLTPADFRKLEELRTQAGVDKILHGPRSKPTTANEDAVEASSLLGPRTTKQDKEERVAAMLEGRKDREFGSKKGKRKDENPHSTTNKEKARKKNFIMMIHKRDVQGKSRKSLRDKQKTLKAGMDKQKKFNNKH
ncbi:SDA1-domain-containing protein [Lipomyces oligophaga]|uniref:SDA1-domain-containing protein n=1 Tax=Lipomyces oligophaga TaxID=45792 RepID=UPI0034CFC056